MFRKIAILTLVLFFAVGTMTVMAGDGSSNDGKNGWQKTYDWFSGGMHMSCAQTGAATACKTCGAKCCDTCQTDCGGKCCAKCCKK
ncbi:MAG: hypothetical protein WC779_06035 [Candidatus Omnitrophota bacterium]